MLILISSRTCKLCHLLNRTRRSWENLFNGCIYTAVFTIELQTVEELTSLFIVNTYNLFWGAVHCWGCLQLSQISHFLVHWHYMSDKMSPFNLKYFFKWQGLIPDIQLNILSHIPFQIHDHESGCFWVNLFVLRNWIGSMWQCHKGSVFPICSQRYLLLNAYSQFELGHHLFMWLIFDESMLAGNNPTKLLILCFWMGKKRTFNKNKII